MATSNNPKHVFDFEGILNMNADPKHWKKLKEQLEEAFGELKIAIQDGLAEDEAQRIVDQFNKIFRQAKLPDIGIDDLKNDFAKLEVYVERAAAAINGIAIDNLEDVLNELKLINAEVIKISKNKGGIKLFDEANLKKVMTDVGRIAKEITKSTNPLVKSITEIDEAIERSKVSASQIQDALDYKGRGGGKKGAEDLHDYYSGYTSLDPDASWEEQYIWMVKFTKAYEDYMSKQKKATLESAEFIKSMEAYTNLYNKNKAGNADRHNMLQNIINRGKGVALVGYTKEPWALEETLQEIKNILQGGLKVDVGEGGNNNQSDEGDQSQPKKNNGRDNLAQEKTLKSIGSVLQKAVSVLQQLYSVTSKGVYENINTIVEEFSGAIEAIAMDTTLNEAASVKKMDALKKEYSKKFPSMFPTKDFDNDRNTETTEAFQLFGTNPEEDAKKLRMRLRSVINKTIDRVLIDFSEDATTQLEDAFAGRPQVSKSDKDNQANSGTVVIDPNVLADALSKTQITADNKDVVAELQNAEKSLGALVAQEDTLKSLRDSIGNITVTPDNSEIVTELKTLVQNIGNLAAESTLQAIKDALIVDHKVTAQSTEAYDSPAREKPAEMGKWTKAEFFSFMRNGNHGEAVRHVGRTDGNYNYYKDETTKLWHVIDKITGLGTKTYTTFKEAQTDIYSADMQARLAEKKYADLDEFARHGMELIREAEAKAGMISSAVDGNTGGDKNTSDTSRLGTLVAQDETLKSLRDSISNITVTPDNSEVVGALKTLAQNLLNLAQEDTLQEIKNNNTRLTREDITAAAKEALYAKEFAANYRPLEFDDVFKPDLFGEPDDWENQANLEKVSGFFEAYEKFEKDYQGLFISRKNGDIHDVGTKDKMMERLIDEAATNLENENWAKVIVEAINDQGGKIVESIKLLLPQEIVDGVDDAKLVDAFKVLTTAIHDLGSSARDFFGRLQSGGAPGDAKLKSALETLGLITNGQASFKMASTGAINQGVAISDNFVMSSQPNGGFGIKDIKTLIEKQNKIFEAGGAVSRIISGFEDDLGHVYQLQERAPGVNHRRTGSGIFDATDEQIDKLLYTFELMRKEGLYPELRGDNIMYDREKGFSVIDLSLKDAHHEGLDNPDNVIKTFLRSAGYADDAYDADVGKFEQRIWDRYHMNPKDRLVNADTVAAEKRARAQAAAQQKNAQNINVTTDNSDVVEAINKLGQSLGTMVAQEDTLQAIKDSDKGLTKEDITLAIREGMNAKEFSSKYRYMEMDEMIDNYHADEYYNKVTGEVMDWNGAVESFRKNKDYYVVPSNKSPSETTSADFVTIQDALSSIEKGFDPAQNDWVQTIVQAIKEGGNNLTKEDIVVAIKESIPHEDTSEMDAPWALESTLNTTIKNILEKIQINTSKLNGVEIRPAVEADIQAEATAGAIEKAVTPVFDRMGEALDGEKLDKVIQRQIVGPDGKTTATVKKTEVSSEQTDESFRTVKRHFKPGVDEEGKLTGEFVPEFIEVIDDLDKLRKAEKKEAKDIERAQKKVNEFLAKFKSKSGGNAQFIKGFNELEADVSKEGFISKENIDQIYNRMLELQQEYAKLETNFRKGQSSLNPFVNAINKAQSIENTFGAVELKFNGLIEKSEDLTSQFNRLRELSDEIKTLTDRMNAGDPTFGVADFEKLSVLVGEFTTTKNQVDGLLKNETKTNKNIVAEQKARVQEWVKLSKQLGVLQAKIESGLFDDATVEQAKREAALVQKKIDAVLEQIRNPSDHLVAAGNANVAAEDKTINAQMSKRIGTLASQYEQLGRLQAQAENAGAVAERERYEQLKKEVEAETEQIGLNKEENAGLLEILRTQQEAAYVSEKDLSIAKDRKKLFEEWIELVRKISALDAKINSGLFDDVTVENAKTARDELSKQIDAILPQLDLTREDYIYAGAESKKSEDATVLAQRQKLFKALAEDYIKLGEAQAKSEVQKTRAAQTSVEQLTREISAKKTVLNLSEEELEVLEAIGEQAKANKVSTLSAKEQDKLDRAKLQSEKKLSKRRAMLGKAGSAIGRADNVWLEAASIEDPLPQEFLDKMAKYEKKLDTLKVKHNQLSNSPGPITKKQREDLIDQTVRIDALTGELGELISQYKRLSGSTTKELGATALTSDDGWETYKKELTAAVMEATKGQAKIKGFNWETKSLTYSVKTGAHEFTEYTAAVRELDKQMVSVQGATKRTETFFEATKRKMGEISSYVTGMSLMSRATQELRRGIQYIREIDLALTELRKVTNETEEEYDQFLKTAAKTGKRLGTTISAVTEATATFAKLGYEMDMAAEMAEAAIVYKNVGDNIASTGDAADSIISTLKGFGMEASEAMRIVDRFNEVGNRFAITSQGIGEALRLSASALNEGANSLDESIGLITAANEVVNDPSSVGKNKLADIKSGYISQNPEVDKT